MNAISLATKGIICSGGNNNPSSPAEMTYGRPPSNNEAKITIQVNNIEIESKDSDIQINIKNFRLEN
jgi:hypothetical protein